MPRRAPDTDRVREAMTRESEIVEATESASPDEPPVAAEPDALPDQLAADEEPADSEDPSVGPVHES